MKLGLFSLLAFLLASSPLVAAAAQPGSPPEPDSAPPAAPVAAAQTVSSTPASAPAPAVSPLVPDGSAAETAAVRPSGPPHYDYLRFGMGARVGYIGNTGYDTFSKNDVLAQVSLDATYAFFTRGKLSVSAGLAWDAGSSNAGARGLTTRLTAHRLTVPIEARYYLAPWLNVFAKLAPGAAAFNARVEDPSSPETLQHAPWAFAADFSGGAAFRIVGTSDHSTRHPRLWVTQEVGYGITSSSGLRPAANRDEDDVLGTDQSTRLGSLALNGVFWRTGLALSF